LLEKYRASPPSLIMHVYANHFRFEHQDGMYLLSSPMRFFFDFIRDGTMPVDLQDVFHEAQLPFFEGHLIVEVHDHRLTDRRGRKPPLPFDEPSALRPSAASLWTNIGLLSRERDQPLTMEETLELESKILLETEEPLCLNPSFQVARVSNA
ncbi:transcription factor Spt20, partial [Dimargaris cristalligena]